MNPVYTQGTLQSAPAEFIPGLFLSIPLNAHLNVFFQLSVLLN